MRPVEAAAGPHGYAQQAKARPPHRGAARLLPRLQQSLLQPCLANRVQGLLRRERFTGRNERLRRPLGATGEEETGGDRRRGQQTDTQGANSASRAGGGRPRADGLPASLFGSAFHVPIGKWRQDANFRTSVLNTKRARVSLCDKSIGTGVGVPEP